MPLFSLKKIPGNNEDPTLMIGGATYDYMGDFDALAKSLGGKTIIANNPFQTTDKKRPDDWEEQLIEGYDELCEQHGIEHLVAHSRGTLHAVLLGKRRQFETITLLHPPLKKCEPAKEGRLNLPVGNEMRPLDAVLTPTSAEMDDDTYRAMLERHYNRYGNDGQNKTLFNILRHDVEPLTRNDSLVRTAIWDVENVIKSRVLVVTGNYDPWDSNILTPVNKTIVRLNQGHYAHVTVPDKVGAIVSQWRRNLDVSAFNESIPEATQFELTPEELDLSNIA